MRVGCFHAFLICCFQVCSPLAGSQVFSVPVVEGRCLEQVSPTDISAAVRGRRGSTPNCLKPSKLINIPEAGPAARGGPSLTGCDKSRPCKGWQEKASLEGWRALPEGQGLGLHGGCSKFPDLLVVIQFGAAVPVQVLGVCFCHYKVSSAPGPKPQQQGKGPRAVEAPSGSVPVEALEPSWRRAVWTFRASEAPRPTART